MVVRAAGGDGSRDGGGGGKRVDWDREWNRCQGGRERPQQHVCLSCQAAAALCTHPPTHPLIPHRTAPCTCTRTALRHNSYVNQRGGAQQQGADGAGAAGGRRSSVYTTTSGSSSSRRARMPVDPAAKMTRDAIKREESLLLNAWTSDKFQGTGVAIAVLVLLTLLLAAGPPPADGRCTLPWC